MAKTTNARGVPRARRRWRAMLWSMLAVTVAALVLPMLGYVYVGIQEASAQAVEETNPRANYWRAVREGIQGYTAVHGPEANVLIQNGGQNWRQYRNRVTAQYGGWTLFLVTHRDSGLLRQCGVGRARRWASGLRRCSDGRCSSARSIGSRPSPLSSWR